MYYYYIAKNLVRIIRKLNKESLMYCYLIYKTKDQLLRLVVTTI